MRLPIWLCLLVALLTMVSSFDVATYPPKLTAWDNNHITSIDVEGPDNPTYPYQQTEWWDRWIWENREAGFGDKLKETFDLKKLDQRTFLRVDVDENGYVVPMLEQTRVAPHYGAMTVGDWLERKPMPSPQYPYHYWMLVEYEFAKKIYEARTNLSYLSYPKVPQWLIEMPQMQEAVALPDGRWIVVVYQDESPNACSVIKYGKYENYLLYSADGKTLSAPHQRQASCWEDILWDFGATVSEGPYAQVLTDVGIPNAKPVPMPTIQSLPSGYIALANPITNELLALYDYLGNPVFERGKMGTEEEALKTRVDTWLMYCTTIPRRTLERVYQAQND